MILWLSEQCEATWQFQKIYISKITRVIDSKPGRVLTYASMFSKQILKSSPTCCLLIYWIQSFLEFSILCPSFTIQIEKLSTGSLASIFATRKLYGVQPSTFDKPVKSALTIFSFFHVFLILLLVMILSLNSIFLILTAMRLSESRYEIWEELIVHERSELFM